MARDDWRHDPVIYQIYPRSFRDSTGTGVGDLKGVVSKLDHVAELGADAIWLSPFYTSPLHDGGYDVADHREVDPRMGTIEDFDAVVARAHELGLKVIVDQVFNHVSIEHPIFRASLEGDEEAARHFIWRDPKPDGTPPNNWLSQFGPPAWTWDHRRRQYYLHQFLDCQPNLNLREEVVQEMHRETMRFWKDRGVDGFRLDAVTSYLWDESFKDNPPARPTVQDRVTGPNFNPYTYQDHVYDMLPGDGAAFAEKVRDWAGDDMYLMGESTSGNQQVKLSKAFTEPGRLDMCYSTITTHAGKSPGGMADFLNALDGEWRHPVWFSCHDQMRHVTALGDGTPASAKFFATLLAVMPGPIILYQGEELGLPQPELSKEENTDPFDMLYWPDPPGREGPRVPMPWEPGEGFGFTDGEPWLPMRWAEGLSVAEQEADADSVLRYYRQVLAWRREARPGRPKAFSLDASTHILSLDIDTEDSGWRAVFNWGGDGVVPVPVHQHQEPAAATEWDGASLGPWGAGIWRLSPEEAREQRERERGMPG